MTESYTNNVSKKIKMSFLKSLPTISCRIHFIKEITTLIPPLFVAVANVALLRNIAMVLPSDEG